MKTIIKIAMRNLLRYRRRTLLTSSLIAFGVALVIIFGGIGGSFKSEVTGLITNSNLGEIQIHKKGYVGSIDNLPLDLAINENGMKKLDKILAGNKDIKAYSQRVRFGAMASNFAQTTSMRFTAFYPEKENQVCPDLVERIKQGDSGEKTFVSPGSIVIPENIANGLSLKIGDDMVLVATNKDGSVNGMTFKISGISENILGPQGKDGLMHIQDAKDLLRIEDGEVTEIAMKLNDFETLKKTYKSLAASLSEIKNEKNNKPVFEIHTWEELSPFSSMANIVSLLIMVVRVILIAIVLISVLNVMMMSVYERVGEIGTIASIGTLPSKILALFLTEGLALGVLSAAIGSAVGVVSLLIISAIKVNFKFGMMNLSLSPAVPLSEVLLASVIVVIISVAACFQPALKASKMNPVDALRHV